VYLGSAVNIRLALYWIVVLIICWVHTLFVTAGAPS
jgi:hypothetical protein